MSRRCSRCGNRLRIRSRKCRHCGAPDTQPRRAQRPGSRLRRLAYGVGVFLALGTMLFVGQRIVEADAIADWYAQFALQHLPQQFSSLAPSESPNGAFLFCVRRVVKDQLDPLSVATFPSQTTANTVTLGEGHWRVTAHVIEDRDDGERIRHEFRCETRYEQKRWVLESLSLGSMALSP
jgi:hypothetical protein